MNDTAIKALLETHRVIAVIGFSVKPERPSHYVTRHMHMAGYTVLPINPGHAGQPSGLDGIPVYASVQEAVRATGLSVGIVNVFRRSEEVESAVTEAIHAGAAAVWFQQGIVNDAEAARARAAGLSVVQDRCIKIEHLRLLNG